MVEYSLNLRIEGTSLLCILLGIISIFYPMVSTVTLGLISGFVCLMVALLLLVLGYTIYQFNRSMSLLLLFFGVILAIFGFVILFTPSSIATVTSWLIYIIGFFMIISGLFFILTDFVFKPFTIVGIVTIIAGILYILIGAFVHNPSHLGVLIGVWLILTGLLSSVR